ncbi:CycJ, partial [Drosophila busckii]
RLFKSLWTEYALDIFKAMKETESEMRKINYMSTQFDQRSKLIGMCRLITRTYKLSRCTLHLSVYYLDRFIDSYTIRSDKLQLVALVCVHIAAQIENRDAIVPRYSDMISLIKRSYTSFECKAVERKILTFLEFKLMRPTTASFVEMLSCSFLTHDDYNSYCESLNDLSLGIGTHPRYMCYEQMLATLAHLVLRVSDYTLYIESFCNVAPSLLAASCIGAVRQMSGIPKRWTIYLENLTSYSEHTIAPYVDIITMNHYYQNTSTTAVSYSGSDSGFEERLLTHGKNEEQTFNLVTVDLERP